MSSILIYSTDYHLKQIRIIPGNLVAKFRIGFKKQWVICRALEFLTCIAKLAVCYPRSDIYIARFASTDNWLIYFIFRKRCTLISDGLSDFLEKLSIFETAYFDVGFKKDVDQRFHVKNLKLTPRAIYFNANAPVAIYNKRGRDPDYVSMYVNNKQAKNLVINPLGGGFSHIYCPASTLLFELPTEMKIHVSIVSQSHCDSLNVTRRRLLISYERALSEFGYQLV